MATIAIRLNGYPEILDKLLVNELAPMMRDLDDTASITVSIREGSSAITFTGVEDSKRSAITLKADEVIKAYQLNQ